MPCGPLDGNCSPAVHRNPPASPNHRPTGRATRVVDIFTSQPAPLATNVAVQMQRLTLDVVGLTAFSHDFGECAAIDR